MSMENARQAALKVLLEDIGPLADRIELASGELNGAHEAIKEDIGKLAHLVGELTESLEGTADLLASLQGIERSGLKVFPAPAKPAAAAFDWKRTAALAAGAAVLASAVTTATLAYAFGSSTLDEAQFGRAVMAVWPQLDKQTQDRITRGPAR
jgi:hypothetical protein